MDVQAVNEARSLLSPGERARADRFVFERDRRDFVAAHALLREALSHHGRRPTDTWEFETESAGKPYLVGQSELQFNIAHTRGLVACALSLIGSVGVDVEPIEDTRDIEAIAEGNFAKAEIEALRTCKEGFARHVRFTELWTLKEAYLKALGTGLLRSLDEVTFCFEGASDLAVTYDSDIEWRFGLFAPVENFRLAVAVRGGSPLRLSASQWSEKWDRPSLGPIRSTFA